VREKYEFIDAEYIANIDTLGVDAPTVVQMCVWLSVSRSGYYEWLARPMSNTAKRREDLKIKIAALFAEFDATYGYRRIHAELVSGGEQVGPEPVRRLMRELGLYPCQPRPYKTTTIRGEDDPATPDLVCRDFTADKPGAKLVGDITYVRTWQGWVYVATVIDCFNNEVIGYAMADHMRTEPSRMIGTSPAADTRFASSNAASVLAAACNNRTRQVPLWLGDGSFDNSHRPRPRGIFTSSAPRPPRSGR
jgi:putative transposase